MQSINVICNLIMRTMDKNNLFHGMLIVTICDNPFFCVSRKGPDTAEFPSLFYYYSLLHFYPYVHLFIINC